MGRDPQCNTKVDYLQNKFINERKRIATANCHSPVISQYQSPRTLIDHNSFINRPLQTNYYNNRTNNYNYYSQSKHGCTGALHAWVGVGVGVVDEGAGVGVGVGVHVVV